MTSRHEGSVTLHQGGACPTTIAGEEEQIAVQRVVPGSPCMPENVWAIRGRERTAGAFAVGARPPGLRKINDGLRCGTAAAIRRSTSAGTRQRVRLRGSAGRSKCGGSHQPRRAAWFSTALSGVMMWRRLVAGPLPGLSNASAAPPRRGKP